MIDSPQGLRRLMMRVQAGAILRLPQSVINHIGIGNRVPSLLCAAARKVQEVAMTVVRCLAVCALGLGLAASAAEAPPFAPWIAGTTPTEPQTQVQRYDADTFVIRQSVRTNFEAPFLYLLFGKDRALLIDTGAGGLAIRPVVDAVIADWLNANHRKSIPLIVAHSHSHGDHHQGDSEFVGRPDTTVVGLKPADVAGAFGVAHWPDDIATYDLGRRTLSIIPTPGHEPAHIMVWDSRTKLLFSGDMLYPGRLYVPIDKWPVYVASADRLAAFVKTHPVKMLLGAHIEMTNTPGKDYEHEAPSHPDEHPLQLPPSAAERLQATVHAMNGKPVVGNEGDFIVFPVPPRHEP
jgi:glyoxylase-like metal-dependent hydrolase (beta-lactamase superfamily II)